MSRSASACRACAAVRAVSGHAGCGSKGSHDSSTRNHRQELTRANVPTEQAAAPILAVQLDAPLLVAESAAASRACHLSRPGLWHGVSESGTKEASIAAGFLQPVRRRAHGDLPLEWWDPPGATQRSGEAGGCGGEAQQCQQRLLPGAPLSLEADSPEARVRPEQAAPCCQAVSGWSNSSCTTSHQRSTSQEPHSLLNPDYHLSAASFGGDAVRTGLRLPRGSNAEVEVPTVQSDQPRPPFRTESDQLQDRKRERALIGKTPAPATWRAG